LRFPNRTFPERHEGWAWRKLTPHSAPPTVSRTSQAYVAGKLAPPWPSWPQYEVLTREHVASLATYLRSRATHYKKRPLVVLEVGAGDGRLAGPDADAASPDCLLILHLYTTVAAATLRLAVQGFP